MLLLLLIPMLGEGTPHLMLHFDINKTLIASDKATHKTKEDVVKRLLIEKYGPSCDPAHFKKVLAILQTSAVFPSFYHLIEVLQKRGISYSIYLRSFGQDIQDVSREIGISQFGELRQGVFYVEDKCFQDPSAIYQELKRLGHVAIHDDWAYWAANGKGAFYGKPFYIDREDTQVISLFFDDNLDENIVSPVDVKTGEPIAIEELVQSGQAIRVDTLEAILDKDYYLKLVEHALSLHRTDQKMIFREGDASIGLVGMVADKALTIIGQKSMTLVDGQSSQKR